MRRGLGMSEGSLHNCNTGGAWTVCVRVCMRVCVCLSYCSSNGRQSVNLGVGDDGHVDSLEVFIPTVTTLGLGVPYHL